MRPANIRALCALEELNVLRRAPALLPLLLENGLRLEDAMALAHNATLLFYALDVPEDERPPSPRGVLEIFSLAEIAALCEEAESLAVTRKGDKE